MIFCRHESWLHVVSVGRSVRLEGLRREGGREAWGVARGRFGKLSFPVLPFLRIPRPEHAGFLRAVTVVQGRLPEYLQARQRASLAAWPRAGISYVHILVYLEKAGLSCRRHAATERR
jgi:hypothetical protein